MTTKYNCSFSNCFPFSDTGFKLLLVASTALPFTIPGTAGQLYRAKFSCSSTADVFVKLNGTAAVPTSGVATATYNEERIDLDTVRYVKGGDVLSFISTGTPQVGVSLLLVQDLQV